MAEKLRAGIVGCGNISGMHVGNYQRSTLTVLTAAADVSEEARLRFGEKHPGVALYSSLAEMLAREKLDMVSICTPPRFHVEPALEAAAGGVRAILLEKPMALNLKDADAIMDRCAANGVTLGVGHQLRCEASYQSARRLIQSGAIGTVERLWGICHGAPLQTNATHTVDLLCFLAGDAAAQWVLGNVDLGQGNLAEGIRQESAAVGLLQFEDGPTALIESGDLPPGRGYHHIFVDGSDGQIELTRPGGPALRCRSARSAGAWEQPELAPALNPVDDLAEAAVSGRLPLSSARAGRAALEIILGLLESARTRTRVTLPLQSRENPLQQLYDSGAERH